jgi:hypothetical protein
VPGAGDGMDNLITACHDCNAGKSGRVIRPLIDNAQLSAELADLEQRRKLLKRIAKLKAEEEARITKVTWKYISEWIRLYPESNIITNEYKVKGHTEAIDTVWLHTMKHYVQTRSHEEIERALRAVERHVVSYVRAWVMK